MSYVEWCYTLEMSSTFCLKKKLGLWLPIECPSKTGQMDRLIGVLDGYTCHVVPFALYWLKKGAYSHRVGTMENANTIKERRSKINRNSVFDCHVAPLATNGNQKHCFYRFFIPVRRLLIMFSIAAYPVCYLSVRMMMQLIFEQCKRCNWYSDKQCT